MTKKIIIILLFIAGFIQLRSATVSTLPKNPSQRELDGAENALRSFVKHPPLEGFDSYRAQNFLPLAPQVVNNQYGGLTVLHDAIPEGKLDDSKLLETHLYVIEYLLNTLNANPNQTSQWDVLTPLGKAAASRNIAVVNLLLKHKANINQPNAFGITPLIAAAFNKDEVMMQFLKEHGADTEAVDNRGLTADKYLQIAKNPKPFDPECSIR